MQIVYLDAFSSHPQELNLSALEQLGALKMYDRSTREEILDRAKDAEIVLTNKAVLDGQIMSQLPKLKYIGVTATGYNVVDIQAAKDRGIVVTNAKNYSSMSVAQHVFALILTFTNRIKEHDSIEKWTQSPDFTYYEYSLSELAGKTIGLVGIGDIGEKVAQVAAAFEMKVLVNRKSEMQHPKYETVSLDELLARADILSLHAPLTDENKGFMNLESFKKMKPSSLLINTGRGPLVDEKDLRQALDSGLIAGAALDVLSNEPPTENNPLIGAKNLVISPHVAWATLEARQRLMDIVAQNIEAWQSGEPVNVVN
ncbi:D-2-hydroxyacid dehydrogenase [Marinilongibacter aquaticus]|uniref:D-2-hydroxyacid dehydrogenase n=1 Tax=Marinilongibacter aquaticus TaxID=2975157 RepID=UPI0021BD8D82|nr:D-2-hydroxyacid dehydrogenase [Marinilongibacter aquaticus]UBM57362.1 D-2-hydroxyacid dehydrogenase [Marinilongibacter aquaticus]